jgi:Protein of unknown function (DUF1638)
MTERGLRPTAPSTTAAPTLVLGCGALARELLELVARNGLAGAVDVRCLPAQLHNRPHEIAPTVDAKLAQLAPDYDRVFVAYADCGTSGALDAVLGKYGAERLPGAHCYATYTGLAEFVALAAEEPGTFYLTDFLARSFDALVVRGLGLDRHPELLPVYFAGYRRVVYLSQHDDPELLEMARRAAARLGLAFEHRPTGYGELGSAMARLAGGLAVTGGRHHDADEANGAGRAKDADGWSDAAEAGEATRLVAGDAVETAQIDAAEAAA